MKAMQMKAKMKAVVAATVAVMVLGGCAFDPIVDLKGVDRSKYRTDLEECREYADEVNVGKHIGRDAAIGAVVGATVGAVFGDSDSAAEGAAAGAVLGGADGVEESIYRKEGIVAKCLEGRGYEVLEPGGHPRRR